MISKAIRENNKYNHTRCGVDYTGMTKEEMVVHYHYLVKEVNYAYRNNNMVEWNKLRMEDFLEQTGFDPESYDVSVREAKADRYERYSNED